MLDDFWVRRCLKKKPNKKSSPKGKSRASVQGDRAEVVRM